MKWPIILFTLLSKHFFSRGDGEHINPVNEIKDYIRENAVKVLLAFILATIVSGLFVSGLVITSVMISYQIDQGLNPSLNAIMTCGLALALTSFVTMFIAYKAMTKEKRRIIQQTQTPHPMALQESLLMLVNDFVKEREFNRQKASETTEERINTNKIDEENIENNIDNKH